MYKALIYRLDAYNAIIDYMRDSDMPREWNTGMIAAAKIVKGLKSADAAQKRRGRWKKNEVIPFNVYVCSFCDEFAPNDGEEQYLTPFCPYCGAEMENPE